MEEHRSTLDTENLRDFIDAYLVEISKVRSSDLLLGGLHCGLLDSTELHVEAFFCVTE